MGERHVDVLIVGAGVSGVGVAARLVREQPGRSYAVLERREAMGGTWDLFKYPGIRSDSDMFTFGYDFRPWTGTTVLAQGAQIKQYVEETAAEYGVDQHTHFGRKVTDASYDSTTRLWTVNVTLEATGEQETWTAGFVVAASGYYSYDEAYRPTWDGEGDFAGQFVHPQFWPEGLDVAGKKVVIIGSGATAITLLPILADQGADVTMLQRTPTYIMTVPENDPVSGVLTKLAAPSKLIYRSGRVRNIALQQALYHFCRRAPFLAKRALLGAIRAQVGKNVDMKHFKPPYNPWDQRLCVVPDGDLFKAVKSGRAKIATDHIDRFTADGIVLKSGEQLEADIVITATGLKVQTLGGASLSVDGKPVTIGEHMFYKGVMLDGVPNALVIVGYTNSSWTLKVDLAASYLSRLLGHMDEHGYDEVVPVADPAQRLEESIMGSLGSGYIQRGDAQMPRQGRSGAWKTISSWFYDMPRLRLQPVADEVLRFRTAEAAAERVAEKASA